MESYRLACSRATLQNQKEGCFLELAQSLAQKVDLVEFSKCSSDKERVKFCVENCWDSIGAELIFKGKDNEEGNRRRMEGNEAFEKGNLPLALLCYSQSLIRTPKGEGLSLVYANRSALLFKMKEWKLALSDAEMSLSAGYPQEKRYKIYDRMASCNLQLKQFPKAKICLNLAEDGALKCNPKDVKLERRLQKLKETIQLSVELGNNLSSMTAQSQCNSKEDIFHPNTVFPAVASKVDIKSTENEGRGVFATEAIQPGEKIFIELPYASCLLLERSGTHCHHCTKKLMVPVPCETCAHVAFCSSSCCAKAKVYHQYECRILLLLIGSGMSSLSLLALRIVTQMPIETLLSDSKHVCIEPNKIQLLNGQYRGDIYSCIHNLVGGENERGPVDFFERSLMAVFLLKCLRIVGYFGTNLFKNPKPTDVELHVGGLLLRNLQILQFNAYEIHETILPNGNGLEKLSSNHVGLGVYGTASFLNHSCSPNVTRYFHGTTLHVVSTQTIHLGQQITDNYGPIFTKMCLNDRKIKLEGRYWFQCSCIACSNDVRIWCLLKDIPETDLSDRQLQYRSNTLDEALKLMEIPECENAIKILKIYLENTQELIEDKLNKNFFLGQEAIKLCITASGLKTK